SHTTREARGVVLDPDCDPLAHEPQRVVPQQRAGQEARFYENLEAVADSEYRRPALSGLPDPPEGRTPRRDGARPEVVPEGEASREDDRVVLSYRRLLVPDEVRFHVAERPQCADGIKVAVAAGE